MSQFGGLNPQTLESNLDFAYLFILSARRRAKSVARAFLFRPWGAFSRCGSQAPSVFSAFLGNQRRLRPVTCILRSEGTIIPRRNPQITARRKDRKTRCERCDLGPRYRRAEALPAWLVGKIWERNPRSKNVVKLHRINGPHVRLRAHNPKVVSSNLTPATNC